METAIGAVVALLLVGTGYVVADGANMAYGVSPVTALALLLAALAATAALTWVVIRWLHRRLTSGDRDHAPAQASNPPAPAKAPVLSR
jgi:membrane protein implicated in regulation of membrane protease activity